MRFTDFVIVSTHIDPGAALGYNKEVTNTAQRLCALPPRSAREGQEPFGSGEELRCDAGTRGKTLYCDASSTTVRKAKAGHPPGEDWARRAQGSFVKRAPKRGSQETYNVGTDAARKAASSLALGNVLPAPSERGALLYDRRCRTYRPGASDPLFPGENRDAPITCTLYFAHPRFRFARRGRGFT